MRFRLGQVARAVRTSRHALSFCDHLFEVNDHFENHSLFEDYTMLQLVLFVSFLNVVLGE
jgi:hypothetical protein